MKPLAAFSTFALYCAGLWLASLLPAWLGDWVVKLLAFLPGLALILWRFRLLEDSTRHGAAAHGGSLLRLDWSGTFWLAVAMTANSVAVSELAAGESLPARVALAALVLTTGIGLASVAWIRASARSRHAGSLRGPPVQ